MTTIMHRQWCICVFAPALFTATLFELPSSLVAAERPNIVLIYADDLGYGDVGCYGATAVKTPNLDRLAQEGLRFTDAHSAAATCTPSRYAMLTGEYAWRCKGTGILPGDAALIIEPGRTTLASMLQTAGYATGVVGKWHLGLGRGRPDWNADIKPGPLEIGFDDCFVIPATGDRVPCVYVENHRVAALDSADPIEVSYRGKIGNDPTGAEFPDLLRMKLEHGHDMTIVNGISRIGYMTGGTTARWVDEDMGDVITKKALDFIRRHGDKPFFLYFATHDIHVPRVPHPRFQGTTDMGPRGDAIAQLDWCVGEILNELAKLGISDNTLVIATSDNGPVLNDGYQDDAVQKLGSHRPAGPLRGGKGGVFEGATRVPFIVRWPKRITPGTSDALVCQIDLLTSLAALTEQKLSTGAAPDSADVLPALVGESPRGRGHLVEQGATLAMRQAEWKYIVPSNAPAMNRNTNTETGASPQAQLYNLADDPGETRNLADRILARFASSLTYWPEFELPEAANLFRRIDLCPVAIVTSVRRSDFPTGLGWVHYNSSAAINSRITASISGKFCIQRQVSSLITMSLKPRTLFEKIWDEHVVYEEPGRQTILYVDLHLVHEVTSPQAFESLRLSGRNVRRPKRTLSTVDHNVPTTDRSLPIVDAISKQQIDTLRANCHEFGITLYDIHDVRQGIVHVIGPEQGYTQPGMTIVCGDSHTSTHGAFGALAFGIGTSEVEHVLATQTLLQSMPKTLELRVDGQLGAGVTAKDVILYLIGQISTSGGVGYCVEYTGEVVRSFSMENRMTVCNMTIEGGARAGLIAPDDKTYEYLRGRPHAPQGVDFDKAVERWRKLPTDADARFDKSLTFDGGRIAPQVSWGTNPGQVVPVTGRVPQPGEFSDLNEQKAAASALSYMGLAGGEAICDLKLDRVFIGSCTNARIEDLRSAAAAVSGHRVASHVDAMVVPGSGLVKQQAEREGLDRIFRDAGFEWREAGCSMCLAMNPDKLAPGERCASTSNRNFEGRQGRGGRTHLVSPAMAAAAACAGHFVDIREWE